MRDVVELVDVDPGAIRPVEKTQASDAHSKILDGVLPSDDDENDRAASVVSRRDLRPPLDAFVLSDVLARDECAALVRCADAASYSFWNASASSRAFRDSDTVEVTSAKCANALWRRLRAHVVPTVAIDASHPLHESGVEGEWVAIGVNPHVLFNKYKPNGHFSPHTDGATIVDLNTRSLYSVLVYLNACDDGGGTALFAPPPGTTTGKFLPPTADGGGKYRWPEAWRADEAPCSPGTALIFRQDIPHEGVPVGEGCEKILIRTDVMYERRAKVFDDDEGREAYRLHVDAQAAEAREDHMEAMRLYRHCARLSPAYAAFAGISS
jgi:leukotriene-A4 hydrolase